MYGVSNLKGFIKKEPIQTLNVSLNILKGLLQDLNTAAPFVIIYLFI